MNLSTPDADEVFNRFINRIDSKKLKKSFGVAKEAITVAETVKEVEKSAFVYFISETLAQKSQSIDKKSKTEKISASKIQGVTFYSFTSGGVPSNQGRKNMCF